MGFRAFVPFGSSGVRVSGVSKSVIDCGRNLGGVQGQEGGTHALGIGLHQLISDLTVGPA